MSIIAFLYSLQLIYYKLFKTFYSFYSFSNSFEVVVSFWQDILHYIVKYLFWIIIMFLPVIVLLGFGRWSFSFIKTNWKKQLLIACLVILSFLAGISGVKLSGDHQHSAYDLYYQTSFPELSTQRLGLLTTMRLDFQRLLTNWSPVIEESSTIDKETNNEVKQKYSDNISEENESEEVEYNVMDIDFDELIANETDPDLKDLHHYFANVELRKKRLYRKIRRL